MKLSITHQDRYSRGELLLRSFFGWIYIMIPHFFLLFFIGIWSIILEIIAFFAILFTAKYPKDMFDFQVGIFRWSLRLDASLMNLMDGYPAFGFKENDEKTTFDIEYPEKLSRGLLLLKFFFGWFYVGLPHFFLLFFVGIWSCILSFLAWWAVLFTGKYPPKWHSFQVGLIRWEMRLNLYMSLMTDDYPPFSGAE